MASRLTVRCPDCDAELVVDSETGAIVFHKKAKRLPGGGRSFEQLFADLDVQKERTEQKFEQEKAAMADRNRLLEAKFQEALKRAEEDPSQTPPPRPFDLD